MVKKKKTLRLHLREIIFGVSTPAGQAFDILLAILILFSVLLVMLDSVPKYGILYRSTFDHLEWIISGFFTIEYGLRLWTSKKTSQYAFSFFGLIDLVALLPSYIGLFFFITPSFMFMRSLRLLRIFRILKLSRYTKASSNLLLSLRASRAKISVFLFSVLMIVFVVGALMYIIEGPEHGFTSIPRSIYWAIVTLTTVGYGDISPATPLGQFFACVVMILGYGVLAVPTGIVSAEMVKQDKTNQQQHSISCPYCDQLILSSNAKYCPYCGKLLHPSPTSLE
ncbi:MAG: ion transporter [Massilibacteroides sp.]|nr:ion transporter [Massilibacteroides sp.]